MAGGLALGCGKNDQENQSPKQSAEEKSKQSEHSIEEQSNFSSIQETFEPVYPLQKAQELIKAGDYESAISVLESYQINKDIIDIKHALLVDAHYEIFKNAVVRHELKDEDILPLNNNVKKNLHAAIALNPWYIDKRNEMYIIMDGDITEIRDTSTPITTLRSIIHAIRNNDNQFLDQASDIREYKEQRANNAHPKDAERIKRQSLAESLRGNPATGTFISDKHTDLFILEHQTYGNTSRIKVGYFGTINGKPAFRDNSSDPLTLKKENLDWKLILKDLK